MESSAISEVTTSDAMGDSLSVDSESLMTIGFAEDDATFAEALFPFNRAILLDRRGSTLPSQPPGDAKLVP